MSRNSNTRTPTATTIPGIPAPPRDVSPSLRAYLEAITEAIEVRLGRRGDPRDRAITLRELIASGLADELRGRPFNPNPTSNNLDFLDPLADLSVPPRPTGFSASGGYSLIQLYWDFPQYGNHSQTEIWRHDSDIIGDAQLVGVSPGLAYVDAVGGGQSYYYWIRHVSTSGVPGPFHDSAGEFAETAQDVDLLLSVLTGAITESQLYQDLGDRIDLIDADANTANSVAARIAVETTARIAAINAEAADRAAAITTAVDDAVADLEAQLAELGETPDWDSASSYAIGDKVVYNSKLWKALAANSNSAPTTSNSNWSLIGTYTSLGAAVGDAAAEIQQINFIDSTSSSAAAQAIDALEATVDHPTTGVTATAGALNSLSATVNNSTTGLSATVTRVGALESTINDPNEGLEATADALELVETAVNHGTTGLAATATRVSSLETTVNDGTTGLVATRSTLLNDYYTEAATDSAIAASATTLNSAIGLKNRSYRQASAPSGTHSVGDLWFESDNNNKCYRWDGSSWVATDDARIAATQANLSNNYFTKTATNSAIASATTNLVSTTDLSTALGSYVTNATLTNNYYTETETDSAISSATTNLVSTTDLGTALGGYVTNATLTNNYYTETETDSAISTATTNLVSTTDLSTTLGGYVTSATLSNNYYTETETDSAISTATSTLVSTTTLQNDYTTTAALQQNYYTKASGTTLEGRYTVKVDLNGYVTGFGLAANANTGTPTSEFIARVDRFSIGSPGHNDIIPFIVQATATTINGVSVPAGVYMNDAFIRNGTITNAKIGDAAVDNAKIANLSVNAAKIQDAQVFEAKIANAAVTNAKIANAAITNAKIANAAITNAKIGTAAVDTLQLAGEAVIVPVADTFSGFINSNYAAGYNFPYYSTPANGLPNPYITLTQTTEVLIQWGVRFQGQAAGAGNMRIKIYESGTVIEDIGTSPAALSTGGFVSGTIRRSKAAGTYQYYMNWAAYNSALYEAYIIVLGIQR